MCIEPRENVFKGIGMAKLICQLNVEGIRLWTNQMAKKGAWLRIDSRKLEKPIHFGQERKPSDNQRLGTKPSP